MVPFEMHSWEAESMTYFGASTMGRMKERQVIRREVVVTVLLDSAYIGPSDSGTVLPCTLGPRPPESVADCENPCLRSDTIFRPIAAAQSCLLDLRIWPRAAWVEVLETYQDCGSISHRSPRQLRFYEMREAC